MHDDDLHADQRRRCRAGSSFPTSADFQPLDRNDRARLLAYAEALDRRTRLPGQHGGVLKRTGLAVLRALVLRFQNGRSGRCDPSLEALAEAAGCSRSTVAEALQRLLTAGLVAWRRRMIRVRERGAVMLRQISNAYVVTMPLPARTAPAGQGRGAESRYRAGTFTRYLEPPPQALPEALAAALARLGHAIADRAGTPGGAPEGPQQGK